MIFLKKMQNSLELFDDKINVENSSTFLIDGFPLHKFSKICFQLATLN